MGSAPSRVHTSTGTAARGPAAPPVQPPSTAAQASAPAAPAQHQQPQQQPQQQHESQPPALHHDAGAPAPEPPASPRPVADDEMGGTMPLLLPEPPCVPSSSLAEGAAPPPQQQPVGRLPPSPRPQQLQQSPSVPPTTGRRRKPPPLPLELRGQAQDNKTSGNDEGGSDSNLPKSFGGLRTLTLGVMAFTLRGLHRRPASNPTPTTRHPILLNTADEEGGDDNGGSGGGSHSPPSGSATATASSASPGAVVDLRRELAATVHAGGGGGKGAGKGAVVGGGRRPRPLAISAADAQHYNVSTILPGRLLISGEDVGGSAATLRRLGVRGVVNATRDGPPEEKERETAATATEKGDGGASDGSSAAAPAAAAANPWCYVKLGWVDETTQPILPDLDRAFACIEEARRRGGPCLIYCKKGMSRSGAVVLAYLMQAQDMTLWEALTFARTRRAIIAPNAGFMAQLVEWETRARGRASVDLEAYENDRFGDSCGLPPPPEGEASAA